MTLVGPHGTSTTQTLRLPDSPGLRIFPVHGDGITEARFTITSVNAEGGPGSQVAIADIEFFSRLPRDHYSQRAFVPPHPEGPLTPT